MQTVYIDIYFLINFTVDFLALYFASLLSKVPTTTIRIALGAIVGGVTAILNLFIDTSWIGYIALLFGLCFMVLISSKRVSFYRKLKLAFCFAVVEMLIGGLVYWSYGFLDKHLGDVANGIDGGGDGNLLILAILVLISIGIFKCLVSLFSFTSSSRTVEVELRMNGRRVIAEALVDTGNLARDPLDMRAVMLVGEDIAERLLGEESTKLDFPDKIDLGLRKRIRLIPVSFGKHRRLLVGFRPDAVYVKTHKGREEIDIVVAIDKEGGKYGDTGILMPSVAIGDVK